METCKKVTEQIMAILKENQPALEAEGLYMLLMSGYPTETRIGKEFTAEQLTCSHFTGGSPMTLIPILMQAMDNNEKIRFILTQAVYQYSVNFEKRINDAEKN